MPNNIVSVADTVVVVVCAAAAFSLFVPLARALSAAIPCALALY